MPRWALMPMSGLTPKSQQCGARGSLVRDVGRYQGWVPVWALCLALSVLNGRETTRCAHAELRSSPERICTCAAATSPPLVEP
jgi:hypothetical protein